MARISFCFRNDLHYLHHLTEGPDFNSIHELLGLYYDKALEDFDWFVEHGRTFSEIVPNMNYYSEESEDLWEPVSSDKLAFSEEDVAKELDRIGTDYLEALDAVRHDKPNDIQSDIDSIKSFWRTEICYKNAQRLRRSSAYEDKDFGD